MEKVENIEIIEWENDAKNSILSNVVIIIIIIRINIKNQRT
jgi:hypothetical protein